MIQFSKDSKSQRYPTIASFQVAQIKGCLDPLLFQWLNYRVTYYKLDTLYAVKSEMQQQTSEASISNSGSKKRNFPSLHESVHSSSDKEKRKIEELTEKSHTVYKIEETEKCLPSNESSTQEVKSMILLSTNNFIAVLKIIF